LTLSNTRPSPWLLIWGSKISSNADYILWPLIDYEKEAWIESRINERDNEDNLENHNHIMRFCSWLCWCLSQVLQTRDYHSFFQMDQLFIVSMWILNNCSFEIFNNRMHNILQLTNDEFVDEIYYWQPFIDVGQQYFFFNLCNWKMIMMFT